MTSTKKTTNYLLRNIPADIWDRAKHLAIDQHMSLRDLLLKALNVLFEGEKTVSRFNSGRILGGMGNEH